MAEPVRNWVREIRESLGLTQEQFAHKLTQASKERVSYSSVRSWERGQREPRRDMKLKMVQLAPPDLQKELGFVVPVTPKAAGLSERIDALEKMVEEQGRQIRALNERVFRKAGTRGAA